MQMLPVREERELRYGGKTWHAGMEITDAGLYEELGLILAIVRDDKNQWLVGLGIDLSERFRVQPPAEHNLYYLSTTMQSDAAVVCTSNGQRFDWRFSVNSESGELVSDGREY